MMVELPDAILGRLVRPNRGERSSYGEAALDDECRKVASAANGTRNDTLNSAAFSLAQLVAGGELDEGVVRGRLEGAAIGAGLGKDEIRATLESGIAAGLAHPRSTGEGTEGLSGSAQLHRDREGTKQVLPLSAVRASSFAKRPCPQREFLDERNLIPMRNVTMLSGDGATGKSLLAMQLAAGVALRGHWLGRVVRRGAVIYVSAEDDEDECHHRLADICRSEGMELANLNDLHVCSLAGEDAVLAGELPNSAGMKPTPLFARLERLCAAVQPTLVVLDNLADVFGGNENAKVLARQFIGLLRGLSMRHACAVVLLSHPSLTGINSGTGTSGNVAWNNSVRSRLYLRRILEEEGDGSRKTLVELDPDARVLTSMKANYGRAGIEIKLRWEDFRFVAVDEPRLDADAPLGAGIRAERVFLHLLNLFTRQKRHVSPNRTSTYAPKQFAAHPQAEGVTARQFALAMETLLESNRIEVEEHGPPSSRRAHLVIASSKHRYGAGEE